MALLDAVSIAVASGIIAGAVAFLQIAFPLTVPLILLSFCRVDDNSSSTTAVAWSALGGYLHGTQWPSLLGADSAAVRAVPRSIVLLTRFATGMAVLMAIAAVVTPLGLYEAVVPVDLTTSAIFHYLDDDSVFGYGTPPRVDLPWSRICSGLEWTACPGSYSNVSQSRNMTGEYYEVHNYDSRVPKYYIDILQSGLADKAKSVSSIFDIQSRSYTWSTKDNSPISFEVDGNSTRPVTVFRQIASLLMQPKVHVVEGLVVDMLSGGIGFRNHSAPPFSKYGSTWTEDLLFVVPETKCVNTNLTIDFMVSEKDTDDLLMTNVVLTDHGGFVDILMEYPLWDRVNPQIDPQLEHRAYRAAWIHNVYTMAFMNITNLRNENGTGPDAFAYLDSRIGKEFPLMRRDGSAFDSPHYLTHNSIQTTSMYGIIVNGLDQAYSGSSSPSFSNPAQNITIPSEPPLYLNPFNVTSDDWNRIGLSCSGAGGQDKANISNFMTTCGMMFGAPRPKNGRDSLVFLPGSNWTVPLYSCLSTSKAILKSVSFLANGSDTLAGLSVTNVEDKIYANDTAKPLWAVEQTNVNLADMQPLWGMVSNETYGNASLSYLRKESLYLPGYSGWEVTGISNIPSSDNLPGAWFHVQALKILKYLGDSSAHTIDYSGKVDLALFRRWQDLSSSAQNASHILDLVWTDLVANSVVGTRGMHEVGTQTGLLPAARSEHEAVADVEVTVFAKRIQYRLRYGIPGILVLILLLAVVLVTVGALVSGSSSLDKMRLFLDMTSQGRLLLGNGEVSGFGSREWVVRGGGSSMVTVRAERRTPQLGKDSQNSVQMDPLLLGDHSTQREGLKS